MIALFDDNEFVVMKIKMKTWFHFNKRRRLNETDNDLLFRVLFTNGEPL